MANWEPNWEPNREPNRGTDRHHPNNPDGSSRLHAIAVLPHDRDVQSLVYITHDKREPTQDPVRADRANRRP